MDNPFEVDGVYENRKGKFKVISFNEAKDQIVIRRLEGTTESTVSLEILANIRRNIRSERAHEAQERALEAKRSQKRYGASFSGLSTTDFKTSTTGTKWRSRAGLAGHVAKHLSSKDDFTFVSTDVYRWPVAILTHREGYDMSAFERGTKKAKFFIELDRARAYFGLYVEGRIGAMDREWDWLRLIPALQDPDQQQRISDAESSGKARFLARTYQGDETFHYANGLKRGAVPLWDEANPGALPVGSRVQQLGGIPEGQWAGMYVMSTIAKDEAIAARAKIGRNMATFMRTLMPLYMAAVRE